MSSDKVSKSINDRYKRLSEENEMIKNQEESPNTANMSEHEITPTKQEIPVATTENILTYDSIMVFLNKYKFWIIVIFILFVLLIIGITAYSHKDIDITLSDTKVSKTVVMSNINKILPKKIESKIMTSPAQSNLNLSPEIKPQLQPVALSPQLNQLLQPATSMPHTQPTNSIPVTLPPQLSQLALEMTNSKPTSPISTIPMK